MKDFEKFGFLYQKKIKQSESYEIKGIIKFLKYAAPKEFSFP